MAILGESEAATVELLHCLSRAVLSNPDDDQVANLFLEALELGRFGLVDSSFCSVTGRLLKHLYHHLPSWKQEEIRLLISNEFLSWDMTCFPSWQVAFFGETFGELEARLRHDAARHGELAGPLCGSLPESTLLRLDFSNQPNLSRYRAGLDDSNFHDPGLIASDPFGLYRAEPNGPEVVVFMRQIQVFHQAQGWPGNWQHLAQVVLTHQLAHRFHLSVYGAAQGTGNYPRFRYWMDLVAQDATGREVRDNLVYVGLLKRLREALPEKFP